MGGGLDFSLLQQLIEALSGLAVIHCLSLLGA